jgi:YidC/Oxa1 family membrane protein insertase
MDGTFQGVQYLILPVMSVVFQYTQQLMAMPRVQDPQQQAMTRMMMFMPLVFAYIAFIFPAGAVLYWTTSSVIGVVQQYFISGWGSLANYLKFLPPDGKAHKSAQTTPASGHTDTDTDMGETVIEQRPSFWDVLRPLTEMEPATAGAALATTSSASVPPDDVADDTPSHTYDEASAGLASGDASGSEKPKKQRSSSRRRSNRRRQ